MIRDFDNDGDPNILVANAGLNSLFRATPDRPLLLYGIQNLAGALLPVRAGHEAKQVYPFNTRDEMLDQFVSLRKKFTDYTRYSKATMTDLFTTEALSKAQKLDAGDLRTVLFRNNRLTGSPGQFTMQPLPAEAQFAPAYALAAVDVNADGLLDLVVGGNREFNRVRIGKADANRGQLFLNHGKGQLAYVSRSESGLLWTDDVRDVVTVQMAGKTALMIGATGQTVRAFKLIR